MTEQAVHAVEETLAGLPARLAKLVEPHAPQLAKFVAAIDIDSPLVLSFAGACTLVHVLGAVLGFTQFEAAYFSVPSGIWRFRPLSPLSYFRLVSHVLGHVTWEHLNGNMVNLLLVGPACEREFAGPDDGHPTTTLNREHSGCLPERAKAAAAPGFSIAH